MTLVLAAVTLVLALVITNRKTGAKRILFVESYFVDE